MRVLNFGSLNLDYVYQVDHFVRPGETLAAASRAVKAGGKGLNQSVALARAGLPVWHAGCLGAGGEMLKDVDLSLASWLLVNEIEAEQFSGETEPDSVWAKLHARYPALSLLITLGSRGSVAYRAAGGAAERCRSEAVPVQAVDTTAAGDTYTGYFIAGLMEGAPLRACMDRAGRAAAIAVTRPGAAESIPWKKELDA